METKKLEDAIEGWAMLITIVVGVIAGIWAYVDQRKAAKQYGKLEYEFVIEDRYQDLGSNWHLIGGRASETEYHVIYRYRTANRPENHSEYRGWRTSETTVSYSKYKRYAPGTRLTSTVAWLP